MRASLVTAGLLSAVAVLNTVPGVLGQHREGVWAQVRRAIGVPDWDWGNGGNWQRTHHTGQHGDEPDPESIIYSYPPYGYPPPPEETSSFDDSSLVSTGKTFPYFSYYLNMCLH
ncbi:hypothetical protein V8F06_004581 [Rhypophila decipiens]